MKKLLATIMAVMILLSATAFATGPTPRAMDRTTIKVGYLDDYGIITTPIVQGAEGYGYEYLEKLEEYTDYDFEYVPLSWAEGLAQLKSGEIDLLAPASMSEERLAIYDFVETIFSTEETNVFALEDSPYTYGDPSQLNGKIIGTLEGSIYEQRFQAYAAEHGLTYTLKHTDPATVAEDMKNGVIDFYVDGSLHLRDGVHSVGKIFAEQLYIMTQKGDDVLNQTINSAMLVLEADSPYYNELLWHKYYATAHEADRKFTADELTALQTKDVYTVGYHTDLHPSSYTFNGEPKGYCIDIMNVLADKLGIKVRYVPLQEGTENSAENVDFNLNLINYAYSNYGTMSEPYDHVKLLIVRDKDLKKSDVKNILVPDYATVEITDFLELYPSATVHKAYSAKDCQDIYDKVDIDCTIISDTSEMFIEDKANKTISVLDVSVPIGITVSNKLPIEVRTALNKAILSLEESTVDELVMENVNALQRSPTWMDVLMQYRLRITLFLFLVGAAFIGILLKYQRKTKRLLEVDSLTGTMTVYKFLKDAQRILATAKPNEYMLIHLDVDKFKTINKVYGTQLGDKLLCLLADSIKRCAQKGTLISRTQSDSFAILTKASEITVTPLDDQFVSDLKAAGIDMTAYFSIGIYPIEDTTENVTLMLDNARTAKSYGKTTFGHTIHYFTKELRAKYEKESAILSAMEPALENGEFFIMVQPQVELQTQRLVGGEALVRWQKKDGTFIYPDVFIPLFEENKFIIQLDHYVLEKTCAFIHDCKLTLPVLSVNVSATTMLEPDFVSRGLAILEQYGVIPQQLEVELTESVLDSDFKRISAAISQLKRAGFSIAIDDFGKGASSLARIKEIEMDVLKLDKDFMENNTENEKGKLVLSNILSMASDLGITSLAEGIETKEQQDLLIQLGCQQGQGYYFDRPLSTADFTHRVEADSKVAYEPIIRYQKNYRFWNESKDLPYGVAVAKNDQYSTIVQANDTFYTIIGYSKDDFQLQHNNRLVAIMVDNLYNLVKKYLQDKQYDFSFDFRLITGSGEMVWVHYMVKYSPEDDLFFVTMIQITDQNHVTDSAVAHIDGVQPEDPTSAEAEKQNRLQEERSKAGIVNLCINMLRTTTTATATATSTTTVLELLRKHYGAKSCSIVQFSPTEQTYKLRHMNVDLDTYPNWDVVQHFPFDMIEKALEAFAKNKYTLIKCTTEDFIDAEEDRRAYESIGIQNGYLAPMFDANNDCNGMLVVTNPSLGTRSPMLIQIVSKFLSDYQAKYDIYHHQKSQSALEPMTGLLNKVITGEKIEALLQAGQTGTLYMVDVDNFKQINDKLGHAMGDKVIVDLAQALRTVFRKDDIIGRIGGDEFIIYAPALVAEGTIIEKAQQIVTAFDRTYEENGVRVPISASVGICTETDTQSEFQHLYKQADIALYKAKHQGKNQFYIATPKE